MARSRQSDQKLTAKVQVAAAQANTLDELRCAQAVRLPALAGTTQEPTALFLGVGWATAPRLQARFRQLFPPASTSPAAWGERSQVAAVRSRPV